MLIYDLMSYIGFKLLPLPFEVIICTNDLVLPCVTTGICIDNICANGNGSLCITSRKQAQTLWILTPAVNKAKDENNIKKFNFFHGLSVGVNMVILIMLIYCFWI